MVAIFSNQELNLFTLTFEQKRKILAKEDAHFQIPLNSPIFRKQTKKIRNEKKKLPFLFFMHDNLLCIYLFNFFFPSFDLSYNCDTLINRTLGDISVSVQSALLCTLIRKLLSKKCTILNHHHQILRVILEHCPTSGSYLRWFLFQSSNTNAIHSWFQSDFF